MAGPFDFYRRTKPVITLFDWPYRVIRAVSINRFFSRSKCWYNRTNRDECKTQELRKMFFSFIDELPREVITFTNTHKKTKQKHLTESDFQLVT